MASYYQKLSNDVSRIEEESTPKIPPNVYYAVRISAGLSLAEIKSLSKEDFLAAYVTPKQTFIFYYPHEGKIVSHHELCSTFACKFKTNVGVVVIGNKQKLLSYMTYYTNKTQYDFYVSFGLTRKDAETLTVAEIGDKFKAKGSVLEDITTKDRYGMFVNSNGATLIVSPKEIETLLLKFIFST